MEAFAKGKYFSFEESKIFHHSNNRKEINHGIF
jgi:hypothetical protein